MALRARENPNQFVLGVRDFESPNVPWRSRFGNLLTRLLFRFVKGPKISDTQTGLRYIPASLCRELLKIPYDRYEFETEMLLLGKSLGYEFDQQKISTI